jgi:hypothetical protein
LGHCKVDQTNQQGIDGEWRQNHQYAESLHLKILNISPHHPGALVNVN